ncbi:MAG: nucleotidyltransferase domain-containing protein [Candidatus Azambacteria bacterium]|nr:nucleotidyltransferase domain-containing protein [Candidatus Azambacteria bacterium]
MNKFVQKICSSIVEQYKQDKNVLGVMLFGSAARNKFDQYSDIDIYILLNKKGKFSRINFIKNGIRVDIILNTIAEAKEYLKKDKNALKRITSHMIACGVILFQRRKVLKKIQSVAKNNLQLKTKYKSSEVLMHKYSIDDFWGEVQRDAQNEDYLAFNLDSHLLVNNIIELFLKLNGKFLKQPNEMFGLLNKLDSNFCSILKNFYIANSIDQKKDILEKLVNYIYKKSGGSLPQRWKVL